MFRRGPAIETKNVTNHERKRGATHEELSRSERKAVEESLMSEGKSNNKLSAGILGSPVALIRLSSILFVGLAVGHSSAYPWTSSHVLQEVKLADAMKSVPFDFMGERSTYWSLYFGWGLLVGVVLLTFAIVLWLLSDLARLAPRRLGAITGAISASCLVGAYLSFRFFYVPPFLVYSAICLILIATTVQLLGQRTVCTELPK
jgi:hypothetical protein